MLPRFPRGFSHPMRIGRGAFASVYRVRQAALDRWVAVKFIYEKNAVKRHDLLGEARTQAKMRAECVPQIFDAFEWRQNICMVMEWIRGIPLSVLLERNLSGEQRIALAGAFIRALALIHGQGFAHRDLKPENVIITPDRGVFLVDFGFSKNVTDLKSSSVTTAKGTPAYMAPELWQHGGQVDLMRADVYAAGKVLDEILVSTSSHPIVESLLKSDPLARPASGVDLLLLWENRVAFLPVAADWNGMAGDLTAASLSEELLQGAKKLLYAHRHDEAYWLLVESIEENGSNHEALTLMSSFQESSRKRLNLYHYALFLTILAGGILLAFLAGKKSSPAPVALIEPHRRERAARLSSYEAGPDRIGSVTLREDSLQTDRLSGRLMVRNTPAGGRLLIDARPVAADSAAEQGCFLHWGQHTVVVADSAGSILVRYDVALLPFQTKAIDLSTRFTEKERKL